ncbi:MAG: rhomboid family intramembrane serine protease [Bacteroidales bacterium]
MEHFISNLKRQFKQGGILIQLIYINVFIFLIASIFKVTGSLLGFGTEVNSILQYFYLPSDLHTFILRPWTLITYMFFHQDILHILFNMLWLYWFGTIFKSHFNPRTLGGLYFLGGIFGGIIFLLSYNVFPYFENARLYSTLIGASASVLAIVVATAFRLPDMNLQFFLLGTVKLKWVALAIVLLDVISITSTNAGGHIAHLGGALAGYIFSLNWRSGKDITSYINRIIDQIVNLFKPSHKLKVKVNRTSPFNTDQEYRDQRKRKQEELNSILEKIKKSGYHSLSDSEKRTLFNASKKS